MSKVDEVADDLAKGKPVTYDKFKIAYKWATKADQEKLRQAHGGYADRADNEGRE